MSLVNRYNLFLRKLQAKLLTHILRVDNEVYGGVIFSFVVFFGKLTIGKDGTLNGHSEDSK